jgi:transcriptional regulator with XRE-family HTH domain
MKTLVDRIEAVLELRQSNKGELARRSGVPKTTIQSIMENPTRSPRGDTLERIADALKVDLAWLQTGRGPSPIAGTSPASKKAVKLDDLQERVLLAGIREGIRSAGTDPDSAEGMRLALSALEKAKANLAAKREDAG